MMKNLRLTFGLNEILLLALEINLGFAGLVMIAASLSGQSSQLYASARTMTGMLPALFCVGFASWLIYRLRCIRQAKNRAAGLAGAMCLGVVALSFGAAVGKLSMVCMTDGFQQAVNDSISSPLQKQAGLMSFLAFIGIGLVFGATFVLRAGKSDDVKGVSTESLHEQIGDIFGALIGCSLGVAGYAYSVLVFQRIESSLFYHSDWSVGGILMRQRFCSEAWRWHRDLMLLCVLSGMFGAGVGWNVTAMSHGSLTDARIIAVLAMAVPFGLVVWLYRGTPRYRLDLPATES
jgi:hypothetical protein